MKLKTIILAVSFLLIGITTSQAQLIYVTENKYDADYLVYEVKHINLADCVIQLVQHRNLAKRNKWFYVRHKNQASYTIYFVDDPLKADIKIYIIKKL